MWGGGECVCVCGTSVKCWFVVAEQLDGRAFQHGIDNVTLPQLCTLCLCFYHCLAVSGPSVKNREVQT